MKKATASVPKQKKATASEIGTRAMGPKATTRDTYGATNEPHNMSAITPKTPQNLKAKSPPHRSYV